MYSKILRNVSLIVLFLISITSAQENYIRGELLVNFKNQGKSITLPNTKSTHNTGLNSIDNLNTKHKCYEMERVYLGPAPPAQGLYKLKFDENSNINSISEEYQLDSNVKSVSLNYILEVTETPDDYYFDEQWNHDDDHLQSELAWNYETGSDEIIISINDTGIDYEHPDLENNIWVNPGEDYDSDGVVGDFGIPANGGDENGVDDDDNGYVDDLIGYDFRYDDNDPQHSSGSHGTQVSGMAAAEGDNTIGVAGVSWNSKLMPTRVGYGGWINSAAAIAGIYYAADNGADVINFSWKGSGSITSGDLKDALDYAYDDADVVLVAAAGNDNDSLRNYPAEYSKVIAVAALHEDDTKRWNSCWGSWIDVSAPGQELWSTDYDYSDGSHTYSEVGATSIASPQVAGLAALIKSVSPNLENWMIRNIITGTTDDIDSVNPSYVGLLGTGRINSYNAILIASNAPSAPTNLDVTASGGHPRLDWDENTEADLKEYDVWRYTSIFHYNWTKVTTTSNNYWTDTSVDLSPAVEVCYYKVKAVDYDDNESAFSNEVWIYGWSQKPIVTNTMTEIPTTFLLNQNYPNPFNPETKIQFGLPEDSNVKLDIYNLQGQIVATLVDKPLAAGYHTATYNATSIPSGVYFYKLVGGNFTDIKRMLLVK